MNIGEKSQFADKMLSKVELNEKYEECLREFAIRKDANEKKFSEGYLAKSVHNLELAGVLDILSRNDDKKRAIEIPPTSQYFDWIIITSYYSMYLAATAALSKIGIKSKTHGSTIIALEYWYCFKKNLLDRKYIQMIENANFGKEDIQKIDDAMKGRISVQYTISQRYGENEAKRILKDSIEFVNKLSEIIK